MIEEAVSGSDRRRLTAVMLTDIVGYTTLTQENEERTLELLREHTETALPLFERFEGRVVKSTGDGFLVTFPSAVEAVRCAIALQKCLADSEDALRARIGVHVGDVVFRDDDVLGDGVNIASRIEPLAEPGGICISRQAYDHVWNKVDAGFIGLGLRQLKNIPGPQELYAVDIHRSATSRKKATPSRRRIAVLPLVNISRDPSDEYFTDGLTEELIFALSQIESLHVIAQTSAMKYRGASKSISEIGRELNIGTALEGSVRTATNRLRITLQLIDVATEEHLWSESYDRELEDVFALQSEIAQGVAAALKSRLCPDEADKLEGMTADPEAYTLYLKGRGLLSQRMASSLQEAIACFERVIGLDDTYAPTFAALAECYAVQGNYSPGDPRASRARARELAEEALARDSRLPLAHAVLGLMHESELRWADAEREYRLAISVNPSCVRAHHWLGYLHAFLLRFPEAISELETAISLDPLCHTLHGSLGHVCYFAGQDDRAEQELTASIELQPREYLSHALRAVLHLRQGRNEEALEGFRTAGRHLGVPHDSLAAGIALAEWKLGDDEALRRCLDELLAAGAQRWISPYVVSKLYLHMGQTDEGFRWLEKSVDEREVWIKSLPTDFASFHPELLEDPRYLVLLERGGFVS
ncbi:MAG: hypothetical protein JSW65_07595 [Candidatus Bipolaricaulota bacterium]|nr:MAG: hypothetical protein JSW65_07595 [Candidatus Bipolaricaulota bacterium]